jgi:hypothetical protein
MKLTNEDQILDKEIRIKLAKEIDAPENRARRIEMFKRYEIYKDRVKKYILLNLKEEGLEWETIKEMQSRISTINLYKKIVRKKARVYKTAPVRKAENEADQEKIDELLDKLDINVQMKKTNKYLEAFFNTDCFVRPIKDTVESDKAKKDKYKYKLDPLPPWKYDVIEDANNEECAMGYIFSNFRHELNFNEEPENREKSGIASNFRDGNDRDEAIADSPADKPVNEFTWWGNKYHFTFDENGEILTKKSPDDLLNPIQTLPIVSFARERDGSFWALGGEDLIDGVVLVNTILSDTYYIARLHGTGLFYFFGKGVPKTVKAGPNNGITLDMEPEDPTPQVGFANANPQLGDHMKLVEQYVALLLTTNDLEPGSVSGKLEASNAASGIQEMIIKAEPINSVEDDQEMFRKLEPKIVNIAAKWHNVYLDTDSLTEDLKKLGKMPDVVEYNMKFGAVQPFQSEIDKLDVIERRLDIGLDDMIDAIKLDNPDLNDKEAEQKALEMTKRKLEKAKEMQRMMSGDNEEGSDEDSGPGSDGTPGGEEEDSKGKGRPDNLK